MSLPDLNLLITLDVLLAEGSVAGAARRLQLSPSAMSRSLARLREATGDPLLVRAGRGLVPTPRAIALRAQVGQLVQDGVAALRPAGAFDLGRLERTFTLRSGAGFVDNFGAALLDAVQAEAPRVRLRFIQKPNKESTPLRDGSVDLDTGVVGDATGPEVRTQGLFSDRFVGVVRSGHALAIDPGPVTAARYAACRHIAVSRQGRDHSAIDDALALAGLTRPVAAMVDGFPAALALARASDLVATVPEKHSGVLRAGMHTFALPLALAPVAVALMWHPRFDADPAHRWLRNHVRQVCATVVAGQTWASRHL